MNRRRLEELAERVAALEAVTGGSADAAGLDARLAAIEDAVRRLRYGDEYVAETYDTVRRCSELVSEHLPPGERVAVAWQGDPALLTLHGRPVVAFPQSVGAGTERDFDHGAAAIAHLEAQRAQGIGFLLIPEPARSWLQRYPELDEHLSRRYTVVADREGVGLLIDVGSRRAAEQSGDGLAEVLDRVLDGERYAPVLDWTGFDLASLTSERNLFAAPPEIDGELPYLDATIDVVVVEDPAHLDEGRRVATGAVVLVRPDEGGGVAVAEVEDLASEPPIAAEAILLVVAGVEAGDPWLARVAEAVAELPATTVVPGPDPWATASEAETGIVAVAEPGVLPLPGCIEIAAATLGRSESTGAVSVKLLDADGALEAAGSTVFVEGPVEGVGRGSREVAAPWHEYVRPVCAASGLLVARSSALRAARRQAGSLPDISGTLRAAGYQILYQPDAWAVRALPANRREDAQPAGKTWAGALANRPERPTPLDGGVWRTLLARDDAEECWR